MSAGNYYLISCADATYQVLETNENNTAEFRGLL
jgi:hypothetical protein